MLPRTVLKRQLLEVLDRHRGEPGIIYCTSRREVDALAAWLTGLGTPALPYHAGLSDSERRRSQDAFLSERVDIIVATVAFGMGIDRSNVRFVVHAGAPRSLEHYQQESGRAGRDGLEAECVLISSAADFMKWRLMLERSGELSDANRALLRQMERYASGVGCRHRHLAEYFGDDDPTDRAGRGGCAACDFCLGELEPVAGPIVLARKILSCVARVDQRFGATHVASVLRGHASEQVRRERTRQTEHLRPSAERLGHRGARLHRPADGAAVSCSRPATNTRSSRSRRKAVELLKDATTCPDLTLARQRPTAQGSATRDVACRGRIVAGRRSRALRSPARRSAGDRAVARRAAVRDLPRRDASGDGAASADVARRRY